MLHNSSIGIVMKFAPAAQRPDHIAIHSLWARRGFVDGCGDLPDKDPDGRSKPTSCGVNGLRVEIIFLNEINVIWVVQSLQKKYSVFQK
jgi:hypothetical protein